MNKQSKPAADDEDEVGPALSEEELEAWFVRNRDALNESIIEARRELAEGKGAVWDFEALLADAEAEFEKSQKD